MGKEEMKDLPIDTAEIWKEIINSRENVALLKRQIAFERKHLKELEDHYNRVSRILSEEPSAEDR